MNNYQHCSRSPLKMDFLLIPILLIMILSCLFFVEIISSEDSVNCYAISTNNDSYSDIDLVNEQNFPDSNFRNYILSQFTTDITTFDQITNISVANKSIKDITGIKRFKNLITLDLSSNDLSGDIWISDFNKIESINISNNPNITLLNVSGNRKLNSLDVSGCNSLLTLQCSNTKLNQLNLSNLNNLNKLYCNNTELMDLNLVGCRSLLNLECTNNLLTDINITDCANMETIDVSNNEGNYNNVPYGAQKNNFITLDVKNLPKLKVLRCNGNNNLSRIIVDNNLSLNELSCDNCALSSLVIPSRVPLETLNCRNNKMSKLDIKNAIKLKTLNADHNKLSSINLSLNSNIITLNLDYNLLDSLNISSNTLLQKLNLWNNPLSHIDLSKNINLMNLALSNTKLLTLNLGKSNKLENLDCYENSLLQNIILPNSNINLKYVDVSQNPSLRTVDFSYCPNLQSIDISNTSIVVLNVHDAADPSIIDTNINRGVANNTKLNNLIGSLENNRIINIAGGTISNDGTIAYNDGIKEITYTYKCNNQVTVDIKLTRIKQDLGINENQQVYDYSGKGIGFQIKDTRVTGFTIEYYINNVYSTIKPIEIGKYNVKVTRAGDLDCNAYSKVIENGLVINKLILAEPTKVEKVYTYNTLEQEFELNNFDINTMNISGHIQMNANESGYTVTVTLKDTTHYEWKNKLNPTYIFIINKATYDLSNITFIDKTQVYDGKEHSLEIKGTLPTGIKVNYTNNKRTSAGETQVTASFIVDDIINYNAIDDKVATLKITKRPIVIPREDPVNYIYDGTEFTYYIAENDLYKIKGNIQTNPGWYQVEVSINDTDNYMWNDNTINPLIYDFVIKRKEIVAEKESDDESLGSISGINGMDPDGKLYIKKLDSDNYPDGVVNIENDEIKINTIYNIDFQKDMMTYNLTSPKTIKLKVDSNLKYKSISLYNIYNQDNELKKEKVKYKWDGDYIVFETTALGDFAIVENVLANNSSIADKMMPLVGGVILFEIIILLICFIICFIAYLSLNKQA